LNTHTKAHVIILDLSLSLGPIKVRRKKTYVWVFWEKKNLLRLVFSKLLLLTFWPTSFWRDGQKTYKRFFVIYFQILYHQKIPLNTRPGLLIGWGNVDRWDKLENNKDCLNDLHFSLSFHFLQNVSFPVNREDQSLNTCCSSCLRGACLKRQKSES
jgi:hypothetical protein